MEKDGDLDKVYLEDEEEEELGTVPVKRVPTGDVYEAARAGDVERLKQLLEEGGVNVNARDRWDSVALYYACLAGHLDAARMLLESGAICAEHTFDGDRCHYAALNLRIRRLLKSFEARPPPLGPLHSSLRSLFLSCPANRVDQYSDTGSGANEEVNWDFPSDITFYVQGRPIEAHRAILVARSSFFKRKFETDWKYRREIRFSKRKLSYAALYSLIYFFYCDRLDIAVDDMEDLVRICKVCRCEGLKNALEKEINHQKYAEYKSLRESDNSQKRFILQGLSLPEEERLPAALQKLLQVSFERSKRENEGPQASFISENTNVAQCSEDVVNNVQQNGNTMDIGSYMSILSIEKKEGKGELSENQSKGMELCCHHANETSLEDHSDVCFTVGGRKFRAHQAILASRSEYFKARLSRVSGFLEGKEWKPGYNLPVLEEHDLSAEAFEKLLEYMYTDRVEHVEPDQAEEMFDAASRYLVFPLKRAVADALLPHIRTASPAELCQWLMLSDLYGVWKIREHCLNEIALDFELFADTPEFRKMLLILPPPSGDSSQRTSAPSAPGEDGRLKEGNILDDLREKWLEAEGAELDQRDASAYQFDKRLEMLILQAAHENQQIQN